MGSRLNPQLQSSFVRVFKYIDLILIMTVEPGFGGQKLIKDQIEKIKETKKLIDKKIDIEVDGGINKKMQKLLLMLVQIY